MSEVESNAKREQADALDTATRVQDMTTKNSKNVAKNTGAAKNVETTKEQNKAPAKNTNVFLLKGAVQDALKGRVGARTHSIHAVLLDAARVGALLSTKEITTLASAHLGAPCNATESHINTMRVQREFIVREGGAWRLSDKALALCGATWAQDAAPAKAPSAPKNKK